MRWGTLRLILPAKNVAFLVAMIALDEQMDYSSSVVLHAVWCLWGVVDPVIPPKAAIQEILDFRASAE